MSAAAAAASSSNETTISLSNGVRVPLVGYGCAGKLGRGPIGEAITQGYLLFDTSQAHEWYDEEELGAAVNSSAVPRERLFLTTKLHPRDLGEASTLAAFPSSNPAVRA